MTLPSPVIPASNVLNTRRTHRGVFRLSPNPVIRQIVEYALGYAANKHNITLYALCTLSNHLHIAFFDRDGNHPEFRRDLHSLIARAVNRHHGESEAVWAPDHPSPVLLYDAEALLDLIAYTIANPCLHHLVDRPRDWPGAMSRIDDLAGPSRVVKRPEEFFDPSGLMPEQVELRFEKPAAVAQKTDVEYRREIARRVEAKCKAAREERERCGRRVLGRMAILGQAHTGRPKSQPEVGTLNPIVACSVKSLRVAFLLWLRRFREEHRSARIAFESAKWGTEFPFGTYLHVRRYGVNCSSVGPPLLHTA